MNINVFDWIRDGVKKSVLLGFSDAVETMGMPADDDTAREKILGFLQQDEPQAIPAAGSKKRITSSSTGTGQRKLGRSINDIHASKEAS